MKSGLNEAQRLWRECNNDAGRRYGGIFFHVKAQKVRGELRTALLNAMKDYDALLVPIAIIAAPLLDQNTVIINGNDTIS